MAKDPIKRICLWSGPRTISTALMYSFAQREDTRVYDEPLYGFYLAHTKAWEYHPGAEETMASLQTDGDKVIEMMLNANEKPVLFFKNMTHHLLDLDRSFLKQTVNVLLTREPEDMITSFSRLIPNPKLIDMGFKQHYEMAEYLRSLNLPVIVVDSKKILMDPEKELTGLCGKIGIPFSEKMLSWKPGKRPEDGSWGKYWYDNLHKSGGFMKYKPKNESAPDRLKPLLEECSFYYEKLLQLAE